MRLAYSPDGPRCFSSDTSSLSISTSPPPTSVGPVLSPGAWEGKGLHASGPSRPPEVVFPRNGTSANVPSSSPGSPWCCLSPDSGCPWWLQAQGDPVSPDLDSRRSFCWMSWQFPFPSPNAAWGFFLVRALCVSLNQNRGAFWPCNHTWNCPERKIPLIVVSGALGGSLLFSLCVRTWRLVSCSSACA